MFTPEFISDTAGEFVLVANHSLETAEAIELSIQYNKARIAAGLMHLPEHIQKCRVVYDIRGQVVDDQGIRRVKACLDDVCTLEFKL